MHASPASPGSPRASGLPRGLVPVVQVAFTADDQLDHAAVRRLIRTEVRKLSIRLDRESRELDRWIKKTSDPAHPLGDRPPPDWIGPPQKLDDDQAPPA